jgi:hypothetical protein
MSKDLIGRKFGDLTVTGISDEYTLFGGYQCNCLCTCGVEKAIPVTSLVSRTSTSCGCKDIQPISIHEKVDVVYDKPETTEQEIWRDIVDSCYNRNNPRYKDFGAKGVTVCDRWVESFNNFISDMGPRPTARHIVKRAYMSKVYQPDVCRWMPKSNGENKRDDLLIDYNGQKLTILELSRTPEAMTMNLKPWHLYSRLIVLGWSIEKTFTHANRKCPRKSEKMFTYNGVTKSVREWCDIYKMEYQLLYRRLFRLNWDFDKAVATS